MTLKSVISLITCIFLIISIKSMQKPSNGHVMYLGLTACHIGLAWGEMENDLHMILGLCPLKCMTFRL